MKKIIGRSVKVIDMALCKRWPQYSTVSIPLWHAYSINHHSA